MPVVRRRRHVKSGSRPRQKKQTANREADRDKFKVGQPLKVKLHSGETIEARIRAIVQQKRGFKLQVDYGNDETALVSKGQVAETG